MKTQSPDTHPAAEAVQIELLRRAGITGRASRAFAMSETVIALSRRAIARAHPEWSDREVGLAFVTYHYGEELSDRVRAHLDAQSRRNPSHP